MSVLLLYTSSYCSQCSVVSSTVHSVAELIRDAGIKELEFRSGKIAFVFLKCKLLTFQNAGEHQK